MDPQKEDDKDNFMFFSDDEKGREEVKETKNKKETYSQKKAIINFLIGEHGISAFLDEIFKNMKNVELKSGKGDEQNVINKYEQVIDSLKMFIDRIPIRKASKLSYIEFSRLIERVAKEPAVKSQFEYLFK